MPEQLTHSLEAMLKAGGLAEPFEYGCPHMDRADLYRMKRAASEWLEIHKFNCIIRTYLEDSEGYITIIPVERVH